MQWLGSLLFTAFLFVWTPLYAVFFIIAASLMPYHQRFILVRVWAGVLLRMLRWTCRLDYRVEGLQNLPSGNHVALWKHSSSWETIAQSLVFPDQAWVLKRELMWIPFVGWGLKLLRAIAVNRGAGGSAVRQVVEQGRARLDDGVWIVVFPEGTRMPAGQTRKYGVSGALLASQTGKLVVPVAHDAGYFWPRRGLLKKPGTITVRIGPPIVAEGRDPREVNLEAQQWIEAHSTGAAAS
ncbi:MAG: lysophospholipid acyltransferase family protein [Steroidobacteraceae bacterium]